MTEKQFWMKLDQLAQRKEKTHILSEAGRLVQEAYENNFRVIAGVMHDKKKPTTCYQLYLATTERKPEPEDNRYLICYTSREQAEKDPLLPEGYELLPIRSVIDNVWNKKTIAGLIFNRADPNASFCLPKAFVSGDVEDLLRLLGNTMNKLIKDKSSGTKGKKSPKAASSSKKSSEKSEEIQMENGEQLSMFEEKSPVEEPAQEPTQTEAEEKPKEKTLRRRVTKGYCYLCGKYLAKSGVVKHLAAVHAAEGADVQRCVLLKVESGDYWLYLDMADSASLKSLDEFLRKIWLECCGHMSCFYYLRKNLGWYDSGMQDIGKSRKLNSFYTGDTFLYDYDFGSTTTLKITVMDTGFFRPRQRNAVRLLARNEDYVFECRDCGKPADYLSAESFYSAANPFICEACAKKRRQLAENAADMEEPYDEQSFDVDMLLPVVNSPRMGVCGYEGELDVYSFEDWKADHPELGKPERISPAGPIRKQRGR